MKQLLLLTVMVSISSLSFAQINKGQWLAGGNASFSSDKQELEADYTVSRNRVTTLQFSPNAGYFITDKLAIGARINLSRIKNEVEQGSYSESTNLGVSLSPFVRYYFLPKSEKLNLFADAGYAYGRTKLTNKYIATVPTTTSSTSKGSSNGYYISAGPAIFITPNTAIELTLSYNYSKQKDYDYKSKGFMTGIGFQIHF